MNTCHIGIGSNLGDREANITKSIKLIKKKCRIAEISSIYETEPVGFKNQEWFLNCAVKIQTKLSAEELLDFLQSIEKMLNKKIKIKNGPRTIDLDILFFNDGIIRKKNLVVPHPRLHKRLFVLKPLGEINPKLKHPLLKKTIKEILESLKSRKIVRMYNPFGKKFSS